MPTLYLRNVPENLYEGLRRRAAERGTSIGSEAIALIQCALRPDLAGVRELFEDYERYRPVARRGAPSAAQLVREDRNKR